MTFTWIIGYSAVHWISHCVVTVFPFVIHVFCGERLRDCVNTLFCLNTFHPLVLVSIGGILVIIDDYSNGCKMCVCLYLLGNILQEGCTFQELPFTYHLYGLRFSERVTYVIVTTFTGLWFHTAIPCFLASVLGIRLFFAFPFSFFFAGASLRQVSRSGTSES